MRYTWDKYFIEVAKLIAKRSSCDRAEVGAVITKDNQIVATGYNGGISGLDNCSEIGHLLRDGHCVRTVHAEINAITQCARQTTSCENGSLYVTHFPCINCFKAVAQAGITTIYYVEDYRKDELVEELAKQKGIKLEKFEEE